MGRAAIVDILKQNAMHLLSVEVAGEHKDLKRATDLIIRIEGGDVAVRIRRGKYNKRYRDLTIRAWRAGNIKTEIHKLREGFGDWYLYAWSDGNGGLKDWMLIDLNILRASGLLETDEYKSNQNGCTGFLAIKDSDLRDSGCMVAEYLIHSKAKALQDRLFDST